MDRAEFLKKAFQWGLGSVLSIQETIEEVLLPAHKRPPGAEPSESRFLELCTGCDACMIACPHNIILVDCVERRTPILSPDQPCLHCSGYPCIASCQTGALHTRYLNLSVSGET